MRRGLLLALVAEEPTVDVCILTRWRSCVGSCNRRCADRSAALEYVDDDHRRTAVPANEGWRRRDCDYVVGTAADTGRRDAQQLAYLREVLAPRGVRQQTVMAYAMQAAGQYVQQEPAHELICLERHGLVACASVNAVVLPAEGNAVFTERD